MKNALAELVSTQESPILSIIVDLGIVKRDNEAKLKHMMAEATKLIHKEVSTSDRDVLMKRLELIFSGLESETHNASVAIFIAKDFAKVVPLNYRATERVVLGDAFAASEVAYSAANCPRFHVLVGGGHLVRLFEATSDQIVEIKENEKLTHVGHLLKSHDHSNQAEEHKIHDAVAELCKSLQWPVVVIGTAHFGDTSSLSEYVMSSLDGNYEHASTADVLKVAKEQVEIWKTAKVVKELEELEKLGHEKRLGSGLDEITQLIKTGRVEKLYLEELEALEIKSGKENQLSVSDQMISLTFQFNGEVVFLPSNSLAKYEGMAAALRY
ncbi:MAG: hypothetical protein Q8T09_04595 [Candidatus Melainabacteria bacterium]|nr:hypothetical protein [Candidatus Melainabacteria bacterium]